MNPAPVPLDKLQALLNKSKAVMRKADKLKPIANSVNESSDYDDIEIQELYEQGPVVDYSTSVNNSNLPAAIKQLMLDKPIPRADQIPVQRVSENYSEDDEKPMPEMQRKRTQTQVPQQRVLNENTTSGGKMITISEEQLDKMINEKLLNFFRNSYDKALTEAAINRTIKTMINEGVISSKKK